ncbi:efflux transporter, putative, hydrophobe/amphiphile efflux-3 (HAE3) family [Candidatus Vecturithrix granuli]|uniref:Efflux transporter, putative, hydrophobe/amphiphile efflux-3 (HAE3) family n=1 Tax=Vecturithrix granuli TaxID=1499967 RepID=A0A081BUG6_VECG1|nr:efflux transporter, putative, hydrophobe/amphiphile efflux-3 (HAE3) family [Candidatus Vecturithrix granuli]
MRKFAEMVLKYRVMVIVLTLGVTLFFGYGVAKVRLNTDLLSYLKHDPIVDLFNRIGDEYGGNTIALTAIKADEIFTPETLTVISQLTEAYKQVPGVSTVMSLTNILDIGKSDEGLEIRKLINKHNIPQDAEELARLKTYTLNKRMYAGKFISLDGKYTIILCRLKPDADKEAVAHDIKTITETHKGTYQVYYSGLPLQMLEIGEIIMNDLRVLVPIVVVVVLLILYVSFKSLRGVVFPLLTVILATLWAVGLMGWLRIEISLISNILPVILIAIGSAYGIHLIAKYYEDAHSLSGVDKIPLLATALSEVMLPIFLAGLTTSIGFLTFGGSYLTAVTEFGLFTAFGVGVAMLLAVTFLPALLSYLPVPKQKPDQTQQQHGNRFLIAFMDRLGELVLTYSKWIIASVLVVLVLAAIAIPRITTQANMLEYFKETSNIRLSENLMKEQFGGSIPIQMLITGDLKDPFVLKEMIRMEKYMESLSGVNNTQSLADLVCEMNDVMNGHYTIPETREQVANLLFMLEGEELLEQLVNKDYSEGVIQARFSNTGTTEIIAAVKALNHYVTKDMDTRQHVLAVATLDSAAQQKLREFQITQISTAIRQDAQNRMSAAQIDAAQLTTQLRQLVDRPFAPLSESAQTALRARVNTFLRDEADVQLEDEELRYQAAAAIVAVASAEPLSSERLLEHLKTAIPEEYWQDEPEILEYTGEFLLPILQEQQHFQCIEDIVTALRPIFPDELQTNPKFREDLRDDLWVLTETSVGVPVALNLSPDGDEVAVTSTQSGMLIVIDAIQRSIIHSQLQSLIWALALVAILMSIQFRSIVWGLIVTSPTVLTILINFAVMGFVHVPLDIATVMVASIAIGIGIDYSIHFTSRLRLELSEQSDLLPAVKKTLATTGQAILINALTVALGFIILLGANLLPLQRFGWILAMTMLVSSGAAMTYLPAMILVLKGVLLGNNKTHNPNTDIHKLNLTRT